MSKQGPMVLAHLKGLPIGRYPDLNTAQLSAGETTYRDFHSPTGLRVLHVRIDRHHTHTSITVVIPWETTLDRTFTNPAEADDYLAFLEDSTGQGHPVWAIEQQAGVITSAAAVIDDAEQALIDGINADWDQNGKQAQAKQEQDSDDAQAIRGDGQGWNAERKAAREHAARHGTRSHVHVKPLTPAELDLIRTAVNGVVKTRPGQSWTMLRAIHRRIGGTRVFKPGTRIISELHLNDEQLGRVA